MVGFERAGFRLFGYKQLPVLKISPKFITKDGLRTVLGFASMVLMATVGMLWHTNY